jgi:acetylornithine/succinyldiaminopimelate/putrescine aminotransferase
MPLGAFISSHKNMQSLGSNPVLGHITTFGGHPVSCAAGKAAMEVLLDSKLTEEAARKGFLFKSGLIHQAIKAIHGKGLLLAMELENFDAVQRLIRFLSGEGIVTDWFLFNDRCVRIAPPLIISDEEIKYACEVILRGLDEL